jgi:CubicO group peptidase (beta-lactamase class C family)
LQLAIDGRGAIVDAKTIATASYLRVGLAFVTLILAVVSGSPPSTWTLAQTAEPTVHTFSTGDPLAEGINPGALDSLVKKAEELHTDSLVILKNGKLIGEWYFGKRQSPIESMSATKSIVSLAIGHLIDSNKIKSLDEPVYTFYPEWKQGRKKQITLRHLLNHTSGLQADRTTEEIYQSPDFVRLALSAELSGDPGSKFFYNNKATNLLAGIVKVASGKRLDEYLRDEIFTPLGINKFFWTLDRAGNPHGMSGLQIHAMDMARIGQMLVDEGSWGGKQIVSKKWVAESTTQGQPFEPGCGLLWWLMPEWTKVTIDDAKMNDWQAAGVSPRLLSNVATLKGKLYTREEYLARLKAVLGGEQGLQDWRDELSKRAATGARPVYGPLRLYHANGSLGQYLVILPKDRLVAVRQIRYSSHKTEADSFPDFLKMVMALVNNPVQ